MDVIAIHANTHGNQKESKMKTVLIICIFLFIGCAKRNLNVDAKVLSINENILSGQLIGYFLFSADGHISNDKIKVGVEFKICDVLFLEDLELQHAELAYYKGRKNLPLSLLITTKDHDRLEIRLNGRFIKRRYLGGDLAKSLINCNGE